MLGDNKMIWLLTVCKRTDAIFIQCIIGKLKKLDSILYAGLKFDFNIGCMIIDLEKYLRVGKKGLDDYA